MKRKRELDRQALLSHVPWPLLPALAYASAEEIVRLLERLRVASWQQQQVTG